MALIESSTCHIRVAQEWVIVADNLVILNYYNDKDRQRHWMKDGHDSNQINDGVA